MDQPVQNTSAAEICSSNGNATVSEDDSKENLDQVINSIHKTMVLHHNSLVSELNTMSKLSEKCNIQIPMEVLRDVLNSCIARNQVTKGKADAFKDLRKHILEELEENFPDEVDKYREIRATYAAEAKRLAQSQPNGDAKVKSEL